MSVFVDTSALYALLDLEDSAHARAARWWRDEARDVDLVTHNYVAVETIVLAQGRLGLAAVRTIQDLLVPRLSVIWVDEAVHDEALIATVASERRGTSFVDRVSFAVMRRYGLEGCFAYDRDFAAQGFTVLG